MYKFLAIDFPNLYVAKERQVEKLMGDPDAAA